MERPAKGGLYDRVLDGQYVVAIIIIGGGLAGLTLGLTLHEAGIPCRIFEAAPAFRPLGAGINILPHAAKILCDLGLGRADTPRRADEGRHLLPGDLDDFFFAIEDWHFDWFDVPALVEKADASSNIRWSIRSRYPGGPTGASRCSATRRTRMSREEMVAVADNYKRAAGYDRQTLGSLTQ